MKIKVSSGLIDVLTHDTLTFGFFADERPPRGYSGCADWRLNGLISNLIAAGKLTGAFLEKVLVSTNRRIPSPRILLIGLGESNQLTYDKLYTVGCSTHQTLTDMECSDFAFDIPGPDRCDLEVPKMAVALVSGVVESGDMSGGDYLSDLVVLGGAGFLDEIVLGMHEFKVRVKGRIPVDILVETEPMEAG